jgi:hypothetical protein
MRELNKAGDKDKIKEFQTTFKKSFDEALLNGSEDPGKEALKASLDCVANFDNMMLKKMAAAINLGDPEASGKYLADLLKFILGRISNQNRQKSIEGLKKKVYFLNEYQIASKKVPPSSSIGNCLALLKTILLEHKPSYIRAVLNFIVRNL